MNTIQSKISWNVSRSYRWLPLVLPLAAVFTGACVPDFEEHLSDVAGGRLLAVRVDPPEAEEGERVVLTALVAGGDTSATDDVDFAFCIARKRLSELGPVDPLCLSADPGEALVDLGSGASVTAELGEDACTLFGPRRPDAKPGEPAGRPADPDPTGGFYQPVVASLAGDEPILGAVRLDCGLTRADREQVVEYNQRYRPNRNPSFSKFSVRTGGGWSDVPSESVDGVPAEPLQVRRGQRLQLRGHWERCRAVEDETPAEQQPSDAGVTPPTPGCGAENYILFDADSRVLVDHSEVLIASWYATRGDFENYRSATEQANQRYTQNTWVAPAQRGAVTLWVVLRDGRGGVGWTSLAIEVE